MSMTLTFQVALNSDYHISAGHGLGAGIDSALLREADGVPVLRGTALVGLLRDGLWRLMQSAPLQTKYGHRCRASGLSGPNDPDYCGQFDPQAEPCPVCRLLGTPRQAKRWQVSSARPQALETMGSQPWQPGQTGAQVVHRARISPRTRRTEPRKLFSQEEGQADLTFTFTISTQAADPSVLDEAALWVAMARNVRQLGRSRRRGQGECLFTLTQVESNNLSETPGQDQAWYLQRFARQWLEGNPAQPGPVADTLPPRADTDDEQPLRFRLIVRADEPLIIAKRAEAGNQFETLPIITGQVVRGALAWRAARRFGLDQAGLDQTSDLYHRFVSIFLRGEVSFPMLYPAVLASDSSYAPTIPMPRNWLTCKTAPGLPPSGHGLFGGLADAPEVCPAEVSPGRMCEAALTGLDGFAWLNSADRTWEDENFKFAPAQRSELHVRLEPDTGRAAQGDLFGYVALEAGQFFAGELVCADEATWLDLQALADISAGRPVTMRLGKASRRGYGRLTMWLTPMDPDAPLTTILQPLDARRVPQPENITLTLLTDTIFTDAWGRFMDTFSATWLAEALGMSLTLHPDSIWVRARQVDGFNAHQGLPRWRDLALVAGSAVRFNLLDPPADWRERLAQVEQTGLGLRRNEGFGRVAFNHPVYTKCAHINDAYSDLAVPLRLSRANQTHALANAQDFAEQWQKRLDESGNWSVCKDARFAAVARWLHVTPSAPPAQLAQQLTELGQPDARSQAAIADYGSRTKENKLQTNHRAGINHIKDLLEQLAQEDEANWPTGLSLLAERVADSVEEKGDLA